MVVHFLNGCFDLKKVNSANTAEARAAIGERLRDMISARFSGFVQEGTNIDITPNNPEAQASA